MVVDEFAQHFQIQLSLAALFQAFFLVSLPSEGIRGLFGFRKGFRLGKGLAARNRLLGKRLLWRVTGLALAVEGLELVLNDVYLILLRIVLFLTAGLLFTRPTLGHLLALLIVSGLDRSGLVNVAEGQHIGNYENL